MNNKFHIIITGEAGQAKTLIVPKTKAKATLFLALTMISALFTLSVMGLNFFYKSVKLQHHVQGLEKEMTAMETVNHSMQEQVAKLAQEKEKVLNEAVCKLNEKERLFKLRHIYSHWLVAQFTKIKNSVNLFA